MSSSRVHCQIKYMSKNLRRFPPRPPEFQINCTVDEPPCHNFRSPSNISLDLPLTFLPMILPAVTVFSSASLIIRTWNDNCLFKKFAHNVIPFFHVCVNFPFYFSFAYTFWMRILKIRVIISNYSWHSMKEFKTNNEISEISMHATVFSNKKKDVYVGHLMRRNNERIVKQAF